MASPAPISGYFFVSVGYTAQLTSATPGGVWSSGNTAIATVNGTSGLVTGVDVGDVTITYTVGPDNTTFSMGVIESAVTNGFNVDRVMPAMKERIGWRQTTTAGLPTLTSENLKSKSRRYYNDFHESCTIKNIYDLQEDSTQVDATSFNAMLQTYNDKVLLRCLNGIFFKEPLIEHTELYERTWNAITLTIPNQGNFVGFRVNIAAGDYAVVFNAISLYFDGVATFPIYLFNDLVKAPLRSKSVTSVANSQVKIQLDWAVNYANNTNGGVYFIGYFQNDLGDVHGLDEQMNIFQRTKIFGALPFQAAVVGDMDFVRTNPSFNFRTYGLNIEMSSYRDYTQVLIQNAPLFDEVTGLCMAITIIESYKNSTRTNTTQVQMTNILAKWEYDLNGQIPDGSGAPYVAGLRKQMERALKSISDSFNKKPVATSVPVGGGTNITYLGVNLNELPNRQTLK